MTTSGKSLAELAELVGGRVAGDADVTIQRVSSIEDAGPDDITFLAHPRYRAHLASCNAGAVIVAHDLSAEVALNFLHVDDPHRAFAQIHALFNPPAVHAPGVSPLAAVDPSAVVEPSASLYPHCYVGKAARIGERTVLMPGVSVGAGARLGRDCVLHPNVTVAEGCQVGDGVVLHAGVVIGGDGFGYAGHGPGRLKVPQAGIVEVGDHVEIGANTTIDRATIGSTRIGAGTKIDNLVQIGHNVVVGERCLIIAQTGIAGSAVVGDDVVLAGRVGVSDHVVVGSRSVIGPRSTIVQSVPPGSVLSGLVSAAPHKEWLRVIRLLPKLPALWRRVAEIERALRPTASTEDKEVP
ncbi:MAG: UDP-3-O-(3-hydroxymyristoyl)glucosamine N-acyltransferase [Deltaproteobacteria bacterium]|nr:UDP-3-O-(3-hydroxymyristoyl)glucosamine N-acyltransferase [Deltaproteobacteria bacterium]